MKKIFFLIFSTFAITLASGQDSTQYKLIVFSGSDWCKPCIRFKTETLSTEELKTYFTLNNIEVYVADFPRKNSLKPSKDTVAYNEQLASEYNQDGFFPRIVLLDAKGKLVFAKNGFVAKDVFIQELNTIVQK